MPSYASHARNAMELSGAEMIWLFNMVPHELREKYVHWMNDLYYTRVAETNMYIYGDLSRMPDNSTYIPDITMRTDEGFVPDIKRDFYNAAADIIPPPFSFRWVQQNMITTLYRVVAHTNH
jgi:hypothetical protein